MKLTAVTGSEWAGSTLSGLPDGAKEHQSLHQIKLKVKLTSGNVPNTHGFIKPAGYEQV